MQWTELPPGHFIAGRTPKLQQFALTPQQLHIREELERSLDDELSPRASGGGASSVLQEGLRRSLSPERYGSDALFV